MQPAGNICSQDCSENHYHFYSQPGTNLVPFLIEGNIQYIKRGDFTFWLNYQTKKYDTQYKGPVASRKYCTDNGDEPPTKRARYQ